MQVEEATRGLGRSLSHQLTHAAQRIGGELSRNLERAGETLQHVWKLDDLGSDTQQIRRHHSEVAQQLLEVEPAAGGRGVAGAFVNLAGAVEEGPSPRG